MLRGNRQAAFTIVTTVLATTPLAWAQESGTAALGNDMYFGMDLGISVMPSISIKDVAPRDLSSFGISGVEADVEAGVGWNIDLGFRLSESFALELESGYYQNSFGGFDGGEFTSLAFGSTPIAGGDGDFSQIPVFINARWEIPLGQADTNAWRLGVFGGVGVVNVSAEIEEITAVDVPGVTATVDGSSWSFGAQAGVELSWRIADSARFGVSYRLMYVEGADFGRATYSDPGLVSYANIETDEIFTSAVQASLSIAF
jgi:opacity protein-like surface antigen